MKITLDIKDDVLQESEDVLNEQDLTLELAVQLFLQKIVKRGSIAWLFDNTSNNVNYTIMQSRHFPTFTANQDKTKNKMIKSRAIRLLRNEGYTIYKTSTFASKNSGANNFWANPSFDYLDEDWTLILNDWINNKLYLFNIPKGSIDSSELTPRADKSEVIDLQIMFSDSTFTDNRSNYSFLKFKVAEINY